MPKRCLYCGNHFSNATGEHIVPEALGGTLVIKPVCAICNNQEFSKLDDEICSKSPLSVVIARELMDRSISQFWIVDHRAGNLMVEAILDPTSNEARLYPQLIFDMPRKQLRGEPEEMERLGWEDYQRLFFRQARRCYEAYEFEEDRKALIMDPINAGLWPSVNRLPPRLFAPKSIDELEKKPRFKLRYRCEDDRRCIMNELSKWPSHRRFKRLVISAGSPIASVQFLYDPLLVSRGLMKIGINLLVWLYNNKARRVDRSTFPAAIGLITQELKGDPVLLARSGFVSPLTLDIMAGEANVHRFWISHNRGIWTVYMSFFGGKAAAMTAFPGPDYAGTSMIEVVAPVKDNKWLVNQRAVHPSISTKVEWNNPERLFPTIALSNSRTGELLIRRKPASRR